MDPVELAARCWVGLPGRELDAETRDVLERYPPDGIVLFSRNLSPDASQIKRLIADCQAIAAERLGRPMTVAIDQEGGPVKRLPEPFGQYPAASSYGPEGEEAVYEWGLDQGRELKGLGITMNLAPVVDVNTLGERGMMRERAYGTDPETVSRLTSAAIRGLHDAGIAACAKHFPGIGHSTLDSHLHLPVVERTKEELFACELVPFRAVVEQGVEAIMVGHLVYPALDRDRPASLSPKIMRELLRDEMGYQGLIVTDDLEMGAVTTLLSPQEAAASALAAGADRVLMCQDFGQYRALVGAG